MVESKIFPDRRSAAIELGKLLEVEYKDRNVMVIGIPRGGAEIGYHLAKVLHGDFTVLVSLKLPFPGHHELAFGATAEDGSTYVSPLAKHLTQDSIDRIISDQHREILRRVYTYRQSKPLPSLQNRIVIVVDDGIATGSTLVPALQLCKKKGAAKIVVAAPVSGDHYASEIASLADEIQIVEQPADFFAVGQAYENFPSLTDEQVAGFIKSFDKKVKTFW